MNVRCLRIALPHVLYLRYLPGTCLPYLRRLQSNAIWSSAKTQRLFQGLEKIIEMLNSDPTSFFNMPVFILQCLSLAATRVLACLLVCLFPSKLLVALGCSGSPPLEPPPKPTNHKPKTLNHNRDSSHSPPILPHNKPTRCCTGPAPITLATHCIRDPDCASSSVPYRAYRTALILCLFSSSPLSSSMHGAALVICVPPQPVLNP